MAEAFKQSRHKALDQILVGGNGLRTHVDRRSFVLKSLKKASCTASMSRQLYSAGTTSGFFTLNLSKMTATRMSERFDQRYGGSVDRIQDGREKKTLQGFQKEKIPGKETELGPFDEKHRLNNCQLRLH